MGLRAGDSGLNFSRGGSSHAFGDADNKTYWKYTMMDRRGKHGNRTDFGSSISFDFSGWDEEVKVLRGLSSPSWGKWAPKRNLIFRLARFVSPTSNSDRYVCVYESSRRRRIGVYQKFKVPMALFEDDHHARTPNEWEWTIEMSYFECHLSLQMTFWWKHYFERISTSFINFMQKGTINIMHCRMYVQN